jgi:hypothetical protein
VEIKGLQVRDGRRFRNTGIGELFDAIHRETRERSADEVHLNATGGFKGTVPYLVLYGMFNELAVSYVYEHSDTLITLPPIAVQFDWERIAPAAEAIFTVFQEAGIEERRWRGLLPDDYEANRDRYDSLFEFDEGQVGLSAIGYLMKQRLDAANAQAEVLISPRAAAVLVRSAGEIRAHFASMLKRVRNPLHRARSRLRRRAVRSTQRIRTLHRRKPAAAKRLRARSFRETRPERRARLRCRPGRHRQGASGPWGAATGL